MRAIVAACAVTPFLLLGACEAAPGKARDFADTPTATGKPGAPTASGAAVPVARSQMAYDYSVSMEVAAAKARGLMARHQQACEAAGPALCQVVKAKSTATGEDQSWGRLELRAEPAWLKRFRDGLAGDAKGAGGHIRNQETEAEDLTRSIVDTEATLRAAMALQTRLERMLVERPGNLQDALAIEQELARVRGTIDATRTTLEVMKGRVATSKLTIDYNSRGVSTASEYSPLKDALGDVWGTVEMSAALLIRLISFLLLPGLIVGAGVWWWLRRKRRKPVAASMPPA